VAAVVLKSHLAGEIDTDMNNLGVYPAPFFDDIETDLRFKGV
jgi:hypothetical protein